jgi:hypothetical protein
MRDRVEDVRENLASASRKNRRRWRSWPRQHGGRWFDQFDGLVEMTVDFERGELAIVAAARGEATGGRCASSPRLQPRDDPCL